MSLKKLFTAFGSSVIFVLFLFSTSYADIVNGDFSNGLTDWTTEDSHSDWSIVSPSTSVSVTGDEYAVLETQGLSSDVVLISLNQWFDIPADAQTLSFDVWFESNPGDVISVGDHGFYDFLQVTYLDDDYISDRDLLAIDFIGPYDTYTYEDITLPTNNHDGSFWYTYSTNIADLVEHSGIIYFDLFDLDDGNFSKAYIDNVSISSVNPVPEPATLMLLGSGLAGLGVFSRRKRKK